MSSRIEEITEAAVAACWRQWSALRAGRTASERGFPRAVLDPEALLLASLALRHEERRLQEAVLWCASVGSGLCSVQRARTLQRTFPESSGPMLSWFAARCVDAGDRRWQSIADRHVAEAPAVVASPGKGPAALCLLRPETLWLQLRAGLGVGVKADLLAFLIGMANAAGQSEAWASAEEIAQGISYSAASVRRATAEMVLARFLRCSGGRPMQYAVDASAWAGLLHSGDGPRPAWRFAAQLFAFVAQALEWEARTRGESPVVQASLARDLVEDYAPVFRRSAITVPDAAAFPGPRYLDAFQDLLGEVAAWIEARL